MFPLGCDTGKTEFNFLFSMHSIYKQGPQFDPFTDTGEVSVKVGTSGYARICHRPYPYPDLPTLFTRIRFGPTHASP